MCFINFKEKLDEAAMMLANPIPLFNKVIFVLKCIE